MKQDEYSGRGRPKKLSRQNERRLLQVQVDNPHATLRELVGLFEEAGGERISVHTVRRILLNGGLYHVKVDRERGTGSLVSPSKPYRGGGETDLPPSRRRRAYPSDLTDAEWRILSPMIPAPLPGGRPETYPRREVVNGILYVLRTGCPWRSLPHDLPPWSTVYSYFRRWRIAGLWERINGVLLRRERMRTGREPAPSAAILDSQSVGTTEKGGLVDTMAPSV